MRYEINKTFDGIDLAHRVDTQQLDSEFTEGNSCELKCRRMHGHGVEIIVRLGSNELVNNMVLDYNELGFIKKLIKNHLDHHTLININDPLYDIIVKKPYDVVNKYVETPLHRVDEYSSSDQFMYTIDIPEALKFDNDLGAWFRAMTVVSFPTTSENICRWLFNIIKPKIEEYNKRNNTNVKLLMTGYKETPTSLATYSEE